MLSNKTKYGIKALVFLAKQKDKDPISTKIIAQSENISVKFLESILVVLKNNGLLSSKRGKFGGYYLLRSAKKIYMTEVMRILDGPIALIPCVSLNFYEECEDCATDKKCCINDVMLKVRDSTLNILSKTSLADLCAE